MTDEAVLLAALDARPVDDTPRLAYADWLDEHDRAADAAYLRAEVAWQRRVPGAAGWFARGRALLRAAHQTPDDWRERVSRPRLAGTTWRTMSGEQNEPMIETVEFHPGGRLTYRMSHRDPDHEGEGAWVDDCPGAWRQFGPLVVMTINHYSISRGAARGDAIRLRGRPLSPGAGQGWWHWTLTPPPGPDCPRGPR